ncbi:MAG: hypothetical protein ABSH44_13600 [Bryobacteraceae bacterium]|jgi:hypothetical protein
MSKLGKTGVVRVRDMEVEKALVFGSSREFLSVLGTPSQSLL